MELRFTGVDSLLEKLAEVSGPVAEEAMRIGVKAGARVIADGMREAAPVLDERTAKSTALESGALRADIHVYAGKPEGTLLADLIGPGKKTQHVALWVEYGHRMVKGGYSRVDAIGRSRGPGHEFGSVRPHPFLRPAFEASARAALEACADAALGALRGRKK